MIKDIIREYYQEKRINSVDAKAHDNDRKHGDLRSDFDRLSLVVEALWEVVKRQNGLEDKHLLELMHRIDIDDGNFDGKSRKAGTQKCTGCGKVLQKGLPACMYCGLTHQLNPFENQ